MILKLVRLRLIDGALMLIPAELIAQDLIKNTMVLLSLNSIQLEFGGLTVHTEYRRSCWIVALREGDIVLAQLGMAEWPLQTWFYFVVAASHLVHF